MSASPIVLQTVPLGFQWPTVDPFLFCVHHLDEYPAGDERFAPNASLAGRQIGNDFVPKDDDFFFCVSFVIGRLHER